MNQTYGYHIGEQILLAISFFLCKSILVYGEIDFAIAGGLVNAESFVYRRRKNMTKWSPKCYGNGPLIATLFGQ